jgi:MFS family permease
MCRTRFGIAEEQVGMASGALIGAYSLASFASSFYLGYTFTAHTPTRTRPHAHAPPHTHMTLMRAHATNVQCNAMACRHLADKYGRKLIVLSGLMSGALGTFLFGLSPNFALAFVSRLFAGSYAHSSRPMRMDPDPPCHSTLARRVRISDTRVHVNADKRVRCVRCVR